MSDSRRYWPQPAATILRRETEFDFYDCGSGGGDGVFVDTEESGYTEIPMPTSDETGIRDRIARLVFRPSRQQQQQQQQQTPPPPLPASSQSRQRAAAAAGAFAGYAYTRWQCLPAASATPPPSRSAKQAAPLSNGLGGGSQRTVRFQCPRERPAVDDDRWAAVQPYSTFAVAAGSLPALGERSASSGYGSDVDVGLGGCGSGDNDFYAVREEDIDRLLHLASSASSAKHQQQQQQQQQQQVPDADLDIQTLDISAYFPPSGGATRFNTSERNIDRIVGDVVRLKTTAAAAASPRRQHQRRDFQAAAASLAAKKEPLGAVSFEMADLRAASASARSAGDASYLCYYQ